MVRLVAEWITALTSEQWDCGAEPFHNLSDRLERWCHPLTQAVTAAAVTLDVWTPDITGDTYHSLPMPLFFCPSPPPAICILISFTALWTSASFNCEHGRDKTRKAELVTHGDSETYANNSGSCNNMHNYNPMHFFLYFLWSEWSEYVLWIPLSYYHTKF